MPTASVTTPSTWLTAMVTVGTETPSMYSRTVLPLPHWPFHPVLPLRKRWHCATTHLSPWFGLMAVMLTNAVSPSRILPAMRFTPPPAHHLARCSLSLRIVQPLRKDHALLLPIWFPATSVKTAPPSAGRRAVRKPNGICNTNPSAMPIGVLPYKPATRITPSADSQQTPSIWFVFRLSVRQE